MDAVEALRAIRDLHAPHYPPAGATFYNHARGAALCAGCETGDPFLDLPWPCDTRKLADAGLESAEPAPST